MTSGNDRAPGPVQPRFAWALIRLLPLLGLYLFVSIVIDPGHAFTGDERHLLAAAGRLLQGRYAVVGTMNPVDLLWHGPGLPALLTPFVALHVPLGATRLLTPLLMFGAVVLFNRFLRLRLSPRLALAGAYALGLYFPGYYVFGTVAKEPLALLLAVVALDATTRHLRRGRPLQAVLAGLALAALAMTRFEYGWVIAFLLAVGAVWAVAARRRHGAGSDQALTATRWLQICAVAMLACLPWLAYTHAITGLLFYWGNSGGSSLYWMSSPNPSQLGAWHSSRTVFHDPSLAGYRPLFRHIDTLAPVQRDLTLQHIAESQALGHPAKYLLNMLANVGRMLLGFPFGFHVPIAAIAALAAINGTLIVGMLLAAVTLWRNRSGRPRELIPLLLFAAVGFGIHLFPSAEPRMVVPLVPVPIWMIGQALRERQWHGVRAPAWARAPVRTVPHASLEPGPQPVVSFDDGAA